MNNSREEFQSGQFQFNILSEKEEMWFIGNKLQHYYRYVLLRIDLNQPDIGLATVDLVLDHRLSENEYQIFNIIRSNEDESKNVDQVPIPSRILSNIDEGEVSGTMNLLDSATLASQTMYISDTDNRMGDTSQRRNNIERNNGDGIPPPPPLKRIIKTDTKCERNRPEQPLSTKLRLMKEAIEAQIAASKYGPGSSAATSVEKAEFVIMFDRLEGIIHLEYLESISKECMDQCDQFIARLKGKPLKKAQDAKKDITALFQKTKIQMKKQKVSKNNDFVKAFGAFKSLLRGDIFLSNSMVELFRVPNVMYSSLNPTEAHGYAIASIAKISATFFDLLFTMAQLLVISERIKNKVPKCIEVVARIFFSVKSVILELSRKHSNILLLINTQYSKDLEAHFWHEVQSCSKSVERVFDIFFPIFLLKIYQISLK